MSEMSIHWIRVLQLISVVGFATLYGLGGQSGKWKRRFIAPFVYVAALFGTAYWLGNASYWYLAMYPLLTLALVQGYGVNSKLNKLTKNKYLTRAIVGLIGALASLPVVIVNGAWVLFGLHILICVATSSILGAKNPINDARGEELTIAMAYGILPMMMV